MDFSNMEVTIDHIADAGAKIKAYATVTFDGMFKVHGVRLAESKQGLNIFVPHKAFNVCVRPEGGRFFHGQIALLVRKEA